jgi:hypothetical protein
MLRASGVIPWIALKIRRDDRMIDPMRLPWPMDSACVRRDWKSHPKVWEILGIIGNNDELIQPDSGVIAS